MKRGAKSQFAQGFAHFGKEQFGFVAKGEQSFRATKFFTCSRDLQHLIGRHRVRAGLTRVAAEGAISAIIAAEICKRDENLARISDYARLKVVASILGGREKVRQVLVASSNPLEGGFAG